MSFAFQKGTVNVTGSVSASMAMPSPSASQSIINIGTSGNAGNQTVYTVTALKKFSLYAVCNEQGAVSTTVYKTDGTTELLRIGNVAGSSSASVCPAIPIWVYQAGENVICKSTTGAKYFIMGVEQ
jgi:hypothetical protein